jgi:hypothetical protein
MRLPNLSAGVVRTNVSGTNVAAQAARGIEPSRRCGQDCEFSSQCTQFGCPTCVWTPDSGKVCGATP